jgi:hypothetical protein
MLQCRDDTDHLWPAVAWQDAPSSLPFPNHPKSTSEAGGGGQGRRALGAYIESLFMSLSLLHAQQNMGATSPAAFAALLYCPTSSEMNDTWP